MNEKISAFMQSRPIAVVGASDKPRSFGNAVYVTLKQNGYQPIPVNPNYEQVNGDRCCASIRDLPAGVESALFVLSPAAAKLAVAEAREAGIKRIWFQQMADYAEAARAAEAAGIQVVTKRCILMYADPVKGGHAVHRFIWKLIGRY
jgi:predicted CoA-binding protein